MNKISVFLILLMLVSTRMNAQKSGSWCGLQITDAMRMDILSKRMQGSDWSQRNSNATRYVPLKLHIVGRTNGTGATDYRKIFTNFCELNASYDSMNIQFYISGDIHYIYDNYFYSWDNNTSSAGDDLMQNYNVSNAINCYIVGSVTGLCGYAWPPGWGPNNPSQPNSGDGLVLIGDCIGSGNTTWQHEMGHYFSLMHTFDGVGGWSEEHVARTGPNANCAFAGDGFCDSPADPIDYRSSCPYGQTLTDPVGDFYNPDETLFMSYYDDACTSRFNDQAKDACNGVLDADRSYLLTPTLPSLSPLTDTATLVYPAAGSNPPYNYIPFQWTRVPGAFIYNLEVVRTSGNTIDRVNILTSDTSYVVIDQFSISREYKWRVTPFNRIALCEPISTYQIFYTGDAVVIPNAIQELSESDVIIYPNPTNQNQSLTVQSTEKENTLSLYDPQGKLVLQNQYTSSTMQLPIKTISAGIYLLHISNTKGTITKKVIIN